jgi:hypothetical protein
MAGQLQINPLLKTYDELQRSHKRMETYLNINKHLLDEQAQKNLEEMLFHMDEALLRIPGDFRKTKHQYSKKD